MNFCMEFLKSTIPHPILQYLKRNSIWYPPSVINYEIIFFYNKKQIVLVLVISRFWRAISVFPEEIFLGANDCGVPPFTLVAHEIEENTSSSIDWSNLIELVVETRDDNLELVWKKLFIALYFFKNWLYLFIKVSSRNYL